MKVLPCFPINWFQFCHSKTWYPHKIAFCKFLSDEIENTFRESMLKPWKLLTLKSFHGGHFRKWFWRYLEVKNECSDRLNIIFHFSANFLSEEVATIIWESKTKPWKLFKSKFCQSGHFRKCFWSYHQVKKKCFEGLKIELFPFCKFLGNKVKTIFWERKAYP